VPLEHPIEEYESVRNWRRRLVEQWGDDPLADDPEKLAALAAFCEYVGKDPDQLLAFCFLRKKDTGARFASVKRRDEVAGWLASWRDQSGKTGIAARKMTNDVLSFFIHGGAMMHPGMIRKG
jgi:hypothetical protein